MEAISQSLRDAWSLPWTLKGPFLAVVVVVVVLLATAGLIIVTGGNEHTPISGVQRPTHSATPPPLPPGSFSFTAAGDHGATSASAESLRALAADASIAFHLALGDLSYNDRTPESAWCEYVKGFVGPTFPFQLLGGNHEEDSRVDGFVRNFTPCLPDRLGSVGDYGVEYYFDYPASAPLARFIMIAADLSVDGTDYDYNSGRHADWLRARVQEAKSQNLWTIIGMHKNCITAGNKPCSIGQATMDLLIDEGVDLVLQGHDHDYQRSHSLSCAQAGTFLPTCVADKGADDLYVKGAGTVFVITGTFGGGGFTDIDTGDPEIDYFHAWNGGGGTSTEVSPARGYVRYRVSADGIRAVFVPTSGGAFTDGFSID